MTDTARLPRLSIALLAATALAYEVLLMRLYAVIQWQHFAYMIISLALLGYGASGALLTLLQRPLLRRFADSYILNTALFGLSALGCYLLVQQLPFNPEEVLWDARQFLWLACSYLLLAVPFLFAATAIGLALTHYRARLSAIYAADLLGAGIGSLGILLLLQRAFPMQALLVLGTLGLLAALVATLELRQRRYRGGLLLAAVVLWLLPADWVTLQISPYKGLPQTLRIKDTRLLEEHTSPLGQLSVVSSPTIPLRHAPGLSLNASVEPPPQLGVFTDAAGMTVINRYDGDAASLAWLDMLTSALPYHLRPVQRVLIPGAGGGSDILQAVYHGVRDIDAVELNPQLADLVYVTHAEFAGHLDELPGVHPHSGEARSFARDSEGNYDLIQLSLLDSHGAATAGQFSLSENYLYTVEGLTTLLQQLAPGGMLAITRWIRLPPRDAPKLFATAIAALERLGVSSPGQQLILIRGFQTSTLVIHNGAISTAQLERLQAFADARSFDTAYYPGMPVQAGNRYNRLQQDWFAEAAAALLGPDAQGFIDSYKFDLQPATDDRPYFFDFFRWHALPEVLQLRTRGGAALTEAGYLVLLATLAQALVASLLLILLPIWLYRRRRGTTDVSMRRGTVVSYFLLLGLAFLFIEIGFIQKLMLFLHHPVYAVTVVLCSFLLFAGLGSAWFGRVQHDGRTRALLIAVGAIVLLGLCYLTWLDSLLEPLATAADPLRILTSVVVIAPLAFCMGIPFPCGLARLADAAPGLIPWAWAINGCASVVSPLLATLLAIHLGFSTVIALAIVMYAGTLWVLPATASDASPARRTADTG